VCIYIYIYIYKFSPKTPVQEVKPET